MVGGDGGAGSSPGGETCGGGGCVLAPLPQSKSSIENCSATFSLPVSLPQRRQLRQQLRIEYQAVAADVKSAVRVVGDRLHDQRIGDLHGASGVERVVLLRDRRSHLLDRRQVIAGV